MKLCSYCGAKNKNSAETCVACGGADFKFKCENCGTVFKDGYCPSCGVKGGRSARTCPECGEVYFTRACPECGYTHVPQHKNSSPQYVTVNVNSGGHRQQKSSFGKVLLWIFFLPIMAGIAIWKTNWKTLYKIIATAVLLIVFVAVGASESDDSNSSDLSATAAPSSSVSEEVIASERPESEIPAESAPTAEPTPAYAIYKPNQYKVGTDIPAGEYIVEATGGYGGYVCVSSDSLGDDIIYNSLFEAGTIITVLDGEYLKLQDCRAIRADDFRAAHILNITLSGVMMEVGVDLPAGEYKVRSDDGESGYYCIYPDSRHDEIIANDLFETSSYVTVEDGQYLELTGCRLVME